eukprot:2611687-Rhodomonas_salina.2
MPLRAAEPMSASRVLRRNAKAERYLAVVPLDGRSTSPMTSCVQALFRTAERQRGNLAARTFEVSPPFRSRPTHCQASPNLTSLPGNDRTTEPGTDKPKRLQA